MLNSLVIKNFRMLEDFTVEKLGRVNLIVGKNNSGKSTVLEALRIYAGNANLELLKSIADSHDETIKVFYVGEIPEYNDEDSDTYALSYNELLTTNTNAEFISIGESYTDDEYCKLGDEVKEFYLALNGKSHRFFSINERLENIIACNFIPTSFISMQELEAEWKSIELTDGYNVVTQALQIILPNFQRLAFDGNESKRWVKVKLSNLSKPVPLKSLGDGMLRILQIAIKLVSAQGGFLLIDEFENGLHYSVQENVWRLLFEMAEKLDIQVFATTHSWDCVQSFNNVAIEKEAIEAMLIHMGKSARKSNYGQIIASIYDKNELHSMTQADIEVR